MILCCGIRETGDWRRLKLLLQSKQNELLNSNHALADSREESFGLAVTFCGSR